MADVRCARCGHTQSAPEPLPGRLRAVGVCPKCMGLIVTEHGELGHPDDRANPGW